MFRLNHSSPLTPEMIVNYIQAHKPEEAREQRLQNYYKGNTKIKQRQYADASKPCNRVSSPYATHLSDTAVGYFVGKPITYTGNDDNLMEQINQIVRYNDDAAENSTLAKYASICGVAYELLYIDNDGLIRYKALEPAHCFPIFRSDLEGEMLYFVRYWTDTDILTNIDTTYVQVYSQSDVATYRQDEAALTEIERVPHNFGLVPVAIFNNNNDLHSKGWRVLRAKDAGVGQRLAIAMRAACENKNIGYNQWRRNTLYDAAAVWGFDISRVNTPVDTDCSALVRTCIAYAAGITTLPSSLRTGNMCGLILATGQFEELSGKEYTTKPDYLKAGDILCTKTSGHTVIVLTDGAKAGEKIHPTLQKGDKGADVANLQKLLMQAGYALPKYGADGDFGDECLNAVKAFQRDNKLTVDGIVGAKTWKALLNGKKIARSYKIIIDRLTEEQKNKVKKHLDNEKITAVVQEV